MYNYYPKLNEIDITSSDTALVLTYNVQTHTLTIYNPENDTDTELDFDVDKLRFPDNITTS